MGQRGQWTRRFHGSLLLKYIIRCPAGLLKNKFKDKIVKNFTEITRKQTCKQDVGKPEEIHYSGLVAELLAPWAERTSTPEGKGFLQRSWDIGWQAQLIPGKPARKKLVNSPPTSPPSLQALAGAPHCQTQWEARGQVNPSIHVSLPEQKVGWKWENDGSGGKQNISLSQGVKARLQMGHWDAFPLEPEFRVKQHRAGRWPELLRSALL